MDKYTRDGFKVFFGLVLATLIVAFIGVKFSADPLNGRTLETSLNGPLDSRSITDILKTLDKATKTDTVIIKVNSPGGAVSALADLIHAMNTSDADRIIYDITFSASSAAAVAMCYADEVKVEPLAYIFFHTIQLGGQPYFEVVPKDEIPVIQTIFGEMLSQCVAKGYLSSEDVVRLDSGDELYIFPVLDTITGKDEERFWVRYLNEEGF